MNRVTETWELARLEASWMSAGGTRNLGSYSVPFLESTLVLVFPLWLHLGPVAVHQNTHYSTVATFNLPDGSEILSESLREHPYVLFLFLGGFLCLFYFFPKPKHFESVTGQ